MAQLIIEGHSDDIVTTEGAHSGEFYAKNDSVTLSIGDAYVVKIVYARDGKWKISIIDEPDDADYTLINYLDRNTYSDRLTIEGVDEEIDVMSV